MKTLVKVATVTALLFSSSSVFAWGAKGHQIVGNIAQDNLSKHAKKALEEIFGEDFSLAKESVWPDEVRSIRTMDRFKPWHFADYPNVTLQSIIGTTPIEKLSE